MASDKSSRLAELERVVETGLPTFEVVGQALCEIRDGLLYEQAGYRTFALYLEGRWEFGRRRAYQLMSAAEEVGQMRAIGVPEEALPKNEHQAQERKAQPARQMSRTLHKSQPAASVDAGLPEVPPETDWQAKYARCQSYVARLRQAIKDQRAGTKDIKVRDALQKLLDIPHLSAA